MLHRIKWFVIIFNERENLQSICAYRYIHKARVSLWRKQLPKNHLPLIVYKLSCKQKRKHYDEMIKM